MCIFSLVLGKQFIAYLFFLVRTNADLQTTHRASGFLALITPPRQSKSGFAPLIIGFTIIVLVLTGSSVSGSSFNPARAFGPALFSNQWQSHWVYWVADFCGAALAIAVRKVYTYFFGGIKIKSEAEVLAIEAEKRRSVDFAGGTPLSKFSHLAGGSDNPYSAPH